MEDEIIKMLGDITNQSIFPATTKFVSMEFELDMVKDFGLKLSKEEFRKFRNWLISKGFTEVEINTNNVSFPLLKHLLIGLGYVVIRDDKRHGLGYYHTDGKKAILMVYALDDAVTIYRIAYFEEV